MKVVSLIWIAISGISIAQGVVTGDKFYLLQSLVASGISTIIICLYSIKNSIEIKKYNHDHESLPPINSLYKDKFLGAISNNLPQMMDEINAPHITTYCGKDIKTK